MVPNIVTDTVDKAIQCGRLKSQLKNNPFFFWCGIDRNSGVLCYDGTMMQFMRNMENIVKYFKMGEAITTVSFM